MAYRSVQDRAERLPDLAAELIQLQVHVMVTRGGTAVIRAAQQATSTIPIVMVSTPDPIGAGFVASLASPGENITGTTSIDMELAGKRLELLYGAVRQASRVAVLLNRTNPPAISQLRETQVAAQTLGVELQILDPRGPDEFALTFAAMTQAGAGALLVLTDPFHFQRHLSDITALALQSQMPAMYPWRMYVDAEGLTAYSMSLREHYRRAAVYVDKILKGAKPADLPVEQPTAFELVINLKTAQTLGLTTPRRFSSRRTRSSAEPRALTPLRPLAGCAAVTAQSLIGHSPGAPRVSGDGSGLR